MNKMYEKKEVNYAFMKRKEKKKNSLALTLVPVSSTEVRTGIVLI